MVYNGNKWGGSHPFELIHAHRAQSILLFPPHQSQPYYGFSVFDKAYTEEFVEMVKAFMDNDIAFQALGLEKDLDYLSGESFLGVNYGGMDNFYYFDSEEAREKYFSHITWDSLKIPQWK